MGNLGCMMNCSYCHNWRTSQAKFVRDEDVHYYTPEKVVQICLEKDISIISWTYNDPVVWQEFIVDTAKLAKKHGILNLYKSAFYISEEAAEELTEYMDVFSLSLKSMDPAFYRRLTQGNLEPVLKAIRLIYKSGKHLELSNLMVTNANDTEEDARKVAGWVIENCSPNTPLHFVRFHPDYKYTHVSRTPIERLARAREIAMSMGLRYVYMGNVFNQAGVHTFCPQCQQKVITRYGMNTHLNGVSTAGLCRFCGFKMFFSELETSFQERNHNESPTMGQLVNTQSHKWEGDILSFHVETKNLTDKDKIIRVVRLVGSKEMSSDKERVVVLPGESYRFVISRGSPNEKAIRVISDLGLNTKLFDLLDRAHFPTNEMFPIA
jgi:pyruvate formate lyase activating enzyme